MITQAPSGNTSCSPRLLSPCGTELSRGGQMIFLRTTGALGAPGRACGTATTPAAAARADPSTRAAASWPASAADPEGVPRAHTTQRCGTPLWSPTGGATPSSLPRASGGDAQTAVLLSPPRAGFSIRDDLCMLLI